MQKSVNPLGGEPPTGEPCAGEPHARFGGGRSQVTGSSYPYREGNGFPPQPVPAKAGAGMTGKEAGIQFLLLIQQIFLPFLLKKPFVLLHLAHKL